MSNKIRLLACTAVNAIKQVFLSAKTSNSEIIVLRPEGTYFKEKNVKEKEFDYFDLHEYKKTDIYLLGQYSNLNKHNVYDSSIPEFIHLLWKVVARMKKSKYNDIDGRISDFVDRINQHYDTNIHTNEVLNQIEAECVRFSIYKKWYDKWFSKAKPQAIILSTHYDKNVFPAIYSAKAKGIKTIEIQHGRINSHEAYFYSDLSSTGKILPDYLFTYGQWWNTEIRLPEIVKIIAIGNPFLESKVLPSNDAHEGIMVSVFSGPQTGVVLSKLVMNCADYFKQNDIHIMYKLHPSELLVWRR